VHIGGQDAINASGEIVGKDDIVAQIEQILANLRAALAAGGARPEHIIKWNIYVVEEQPLQAAFAAFQNACAQDAQPAGHHVGVGIGSCASQLLGGDGARFSEVVCEVAFLKICRLPDVPIAETGYYPRWLRNGVGDFIF
jgi:enamine deaminase RidA (YjgF/YER057c/UK114 family)